MMCSYSPHVLAMFSLIVHIQLKKLTAAGKKMCLSVLLFHSVHYQAFFTFRNVRLLDCLTSFAPLVTRGS